MSDKLMARILVRLHGLDKGTEGRLRQLVGEDLWLQLASPRIQAREIFANAGNLIRLHKDDDNHLIYRIV